MEAKPSGEARKTRTWVKRIVIATVLAVAISAASTAAAVLIGYDPLEEGSSGGTPGITVPFVDTHQPFESAVEDHRIVTYVEGGFIPVGFSIANRGHWGVTILNVEVPSPPLRLFTVTELERGVAKRCCADFEPFRPFVLRPDEDRPFVLLGVMTGCGNFAADTLYGWNSYRVTYRFAGITHTRTISSRYRIEIHIPKGYRCNETPNGLPRLTERRPPTRRSP